MDYGYGKPIVLPAFGKPVPVFGKPIVPPVYGKPIPVFGKPVFGKPIYGKPLPVFGKPVPVPLAVPFFRPRLFPWRFGFPI